MLLPTKEIKETLGRVDRLVDEATLLVKDLRMILRAVCDGVAQQRGDGQ